MKHYYSIFIFPLLFLLAFDTKAQPNWNFASTPADNLEALNNEDNNWKYDSNNEHYANRAAMTGDFQANGQELTMTKRLTPFCSDSNKIRIDKNKYLVLNGKYNNAAGKVEITDAKGWMESTYVKWKKLKDYTAYNVYIKGENITTYTKIDKELVRSYGDSLRADMVGLKAGNYQMKVVPVSNENELTNNANEATNLVVTSYDRQGFAHMSTTGVGAYNNDGTLKKDARVIYITKNTAKTVTCLVKTSSKDGDGILQTGLQAILSAYQKGYETRPLAVRLIGLIEKDDVDYFASSEEGLQIKGKSSYSPMNITIEGIGDDATVRGFGFLVRNSTHVEFRNFAIMRCMDDCISFDTANRYVWVHNMDLFYGTSGSDDHAKGDGTVDLKGDTQYMTVSYNHFFDTGKNSLCGMKRETGPNYICYHHNWFDHSDSRNPRVRTMSVHVWNNYFDGVSKYGVGSTTGSSVFVEANYFRATKRPMLSSQQGTDAKGDGNFSGETGGLIKSFGNLYAETAGSNYKPIIQKDDSTSFDCYEADSRGEKVPDTFKTIAGGTTYDNFDTNSDLMYTYIPDAACNVPERVTGWNGAGRMNHGDFKWNFTSDDDKDSDINSALATAIDNYQSSLVGINE
ncbi:MAG: pectate lyase family protein [Prevotella sp.]|jgi:pectate lyase